MRAANMRGIDQRQRTLVLKIDSHLCLWCFCNTQSHQAPCKLRCVRVDNERFVQYSTIKLKSVRLRNNNDFDQILRNECGQINRRFIKYRFIQYEWGRVGDCVDYSAIDVCKEPN